MFEQTHAHVCDEKAKTTLQMSTSAGGFFFLPLLFFVLYGSHSDRAFAFVITYCAEVNVISIGSKRWRQLIMFFQMDWGKKALV